MLVHWQVTIKLKSKHVEGDFFWQVNKFIGSTTWGKTQVLKYMSFNTNTGKVRGTPTPNKPTPPYTKSLPKIYLQLGS